MKKLLATFALVSACGSSTPKGSGVDQGVSHDLAGDLASSSMTSGDLAQQQACAPPPMPAGAGVELGPDFAGVYTAYALGPVPGVPDPLGGAVVSYADANTLLIGGASERADGAIYSIGVERDACHHIIGFVGTATLVANTPYVDANLLYGQGHDLLYSEWPEYKIGQLLPSAMSPAEETDLTTLGITMTDQGPGGLDFVPPGLTAAGELRLVTWSGGNWCHVAASYTSGLYDMTNISCTVVLPNQPGGMAYVPAGSPAFTKQSVIVSEWAGTANDKVGVYEVDDEGDPIVSTRRDFMQKFPAPWGAYFEPLTGDYLFLTWGTGNDSVYVVQGFATPPPIQ